MNLNDVSEAAAAVEYPLVYRNLIAVALIGEVNGFQQDSEVVATAVESTMARPTQFRIYRAIAKGVAGDADGAAAALASELEGEPNGDAARVGLAVALMLAGNDRWKEVVDLVMATSNDQDAREASARILDLAQGFDQRFN